MAYPPSPAKVVPPMIRHERHSSPTGGGEEGDETEAIVGGGEDEGWPVKVEGIKLERGAMREKSEVLRGVLMICEGLSWCGGEWTTRSKDEAHLLPFASLATPTPSKPTTMHTRAQQQTIVLIQATSTSRRQANEAAELAEVLLSRFRSFPPSADRAHSSFSALLLSQTLGQLTIANRSSTSPPKTSSSRGAFAK